MKCLVSGSKPEQCLLFASVAKNLPASAGHAGDGGLISGLGRSPGEGNGCPLWYLPGEAHEQSLAGYKSISSHRVEHE